jgi:hypothetical protein
MLVPYTLSRVMISGAQSEHSFGLCYVRISLSVCLPACLPACLSVCRVRTLSPHQQVTPNENHKIKYNKYTSNNIFAPLALRYFCLFIQKRMCNYRNSRRMLLTVVWGRYCSWLDVFISSGRPDYHITVTHLAIRPHARRSTDGKWHTTVVRQNNDPLAQRTKLCKPCTG